MVGLTVSMVRVSELLESGAVQWELPDESEKAAGCNGDECISGAVL